MKILKTVAEVREAYSPEEVGLVPTMGYLHEGHLSLIAKARRENRLVVASIFVNPTQFGPSEDYAAYPRDLARDAKLAQEAGCDFIFAPSPQEMYASNFSTYVNVEGITQKLCGISRPSHFRGVATVVSKLFNIIRPTRAYFGQKDAQQALVLRRMVADLNFPLEIRTAPTVREADGLARSSRNTYLNAEERRAAPALYRSLLAAKAAFAQGERRAEKLLAAAQDVLALEPRVQIEYLSLVDPLTLEDVSAVEKQALLALAAKCGQVRLIDNVMLGSGLVNWEEDENAQKHV
jgi:pantoate--beta-alanine ligase